MIQENIMYDKRLRKNSWIYKFLLILSFIWLEMYASSFFLIFGTGSVFSSVNFSSTLTIVLTYGILSWVAFEILFWIYRQILSTKIYSFLVPIESLKAETRLYFTIRNVILGLVCNLCFLFPYLYSFVPFFDLLITLVVIIAFAKNLTNVYSDAIVGHFVFKNFCYPIFVYELFHNSAALYCRIEFRRDSCPGAACRPCRFHRSDRA